MKKQPLTETVSPIYIQFHDGTQQVFIKEPTKIIKRTPTKAIMLLYGELISFIDNKWVYKP